MGATAWELLTGARLFACASDVETLRAISERRIAPPSELRTDLPRAVDEVVLRALARDPGERYATARELGRALLAATTGDAGIPSVDDLSEWMRTLFPTGAERSRDLLARASVRPLAPPLAVPEPPPRKSELEVLPSEDLVTVSTTAPDARPTLRALRAVRWESLSPTLRRMAFPFAALVTGIGLRQAANCRQPSLEAQRGAAASPARATERLAAAPGIPLTLPKPSEPSPPGAAVERGPQQSTRYFIDVEHDGGALVLRIEGRPRENLSATAASQALAEQGDKVRREAVSKRRP